MLDLAPYLRFPSLFFIFMTGFKTSFMNPVISYADVDCSDPAFLHNHLLQFVAITKRVASSHTVGKIKVSTNLKSSIVRQSKKCSSLSSKRLASAPPTSRLVTPSSDKSSDRVFR